MHSCAPYTLGHPCKGAQDAHPYSSKLRAGSPTLRTCGPLEGWTRSEGAQLPLGPCLSCIKPRVHCAPSTDAHLQILNRVCKVHKCLSWMKVFTCPPLEGCAVHTCSFVFISHIVGCAEFDGMKVWSTDVEALKVHVRGLRKRRMWWVTVCRGVVYIGTWLYTPCAHLEGAQVRGYTSALMHVVHPAHPPYAWKGAQVCNLQKHVFSSPWKMQSWFDALPSDNSTQD